MEIITRLTIAVTEVDSLHSTHDHNQVLHYVPHRNTISAIGWRIHVYCVKLVHNCSTPYHVICCIACSPLHCSLFALRGKDTGFSTDLHSLLNTVSAISWRIDVYRMELVHIAVAYTIPRNLLHCK